MNILTSWKSSLIGLLSLVSALVRVVIDAHQTSFMAALKDPITLSLLLTAAIGALVKDSDVTGGKRGQPSTEQAILDSNHAPAAGLAAPVDSPQKIAQASAEDRARVEADPSKKTP